MDDAFTRACALDTDGNPDAAREAYIAMLRIDPTHVGALTNLGTLLYHNGYRRAGRLAYAEAVSRHPAHLLARLNLAAALLDEGEHERAREQYEVALLLDSDDIRVHQGLAILSARNGDWRAAHRHGSLGFRSAPVRSSPVYRAAKRTRILLLTSAIGGNVDTERIFDPELFACDTLIAEFYEPQMRIENYALVFNAVGDAERSALALERAARFLHGYPVRALNRPEAVQATTRLHNAHRFASIRGVRTAKTTQHTRSSLRAEDLTYPTLIRSPGYHTGEHFLRVERAADLETALALLPTEEILALEYIDTRERDGFFRKYRASIVGERLFPLHLAMSKDWKVHYYSAEMTSPLHRAEELAFLADMPRTLGRRAMDALHEIRAGLSLDYGGIDFTVDARGDLVLFEANATMNLLPPEEGSAPERIAAVTAVRSAVTQLLQECATAGNR
ncbi:MAG TPA: tetratricopeptide repeat protein [Candidatus Dormibacteraeota bacterium]|nr:tetratricopeptide repeat protein [Candidatus Dormibacteraeota bacterium]